MWALIKKSYRYLTIFLFSWDYSETQMVAFYQSHLAPNSNWNKNATSVSDLDLLYSTCHILPYTIAYTDWSWTWFFWLSLKAWRNWPT